MSRLVRFGVVADLQYGDFGNRTNYTGTRKRFYRNAIDILKRAVDAWKHEEVDFIVQMGDIIDGFNAFEFNSTEAAITDVMAVIRQKMPLTPVFHVIGNHELYNFHRKDLAVVFPHPGDYQLSSYDLRDSRACFFMPSSQIGFMIIDNYEFSMLGYPENAIFNEARDFLMSNNHNHHELNSPDGLCGTDMRFCKYNGSVSQEQLDWMENILLTADKNGVAVIVLGHQPVYPEACDPACLEWRFKEFLRILQIHISVKVYLAGHNHDGGYAKDVTGIHHITFEGAIETEPGIDCFGIVDVFVDRLEVIGRGRVPSRICHFRL